MRRAKQYARAHGKSLSKVIEQYLSYVTQDELPPTDVTEEVARLSDTLPASPAERDLKYEYLAERYLRDFVRVLPMTEADVDRAIQSPGDDVEDSLQHHCAAASAVRIIVTRNGDDFRTEGFQALAPDEFMRMDLSEKST